MVRNGLTSRAAWVALVAALAMVVQAITASYAMARPAVQTIEVCTSHGSKTISLDKYGAPTDGKSAPCEHCDHCLSFAVAGPNEVRTYALAVSYAEPALFASSAAVQSPYAARAPPRPPSQAPPSVLNV